MMKKIGYICSIIMLVLGCVSCDFEHSDNGRLDGFWHLERVDTLATKGMKNLSETRLFWSFQGKLMVLSDKDGKHYECILRFEQRDGKLLLSQPIISDREQGDSLLTEPTALRDYGINSVNETYTIESLASTKMLLSNDNYRLFLRKF